MDEIRSSYKGFLDAAGGKDLLQWLVNKEVGAQLKGRQADTMEGKALAMVELNLCYEIRSHLADMSQPGKESKKPLGRQTRSGGPKA